MLGICQGRIPSKRQKRVTRMDSLTIGVVDLSPNVTTCHVSNWSFMIFVGYNFSFVPPPLPACNRSTWLRLSWDPRTQERVASWSRGETTRGNNSGDSYHHLPPGDLGKFVSSARPWDHFGGVIQKQWQHWFPQTTWMCLRRFFLIWYHSKRPCKPPCGIYSIFSNYLQKIQEIVVWITGVNNLLLIMSKWLIQNCPSFWWVFYPVMKTSKRKDLLQKSPTKWAPTNYK